MQTFPQILLECSWEGADKQTIGLNEKNGQVVVRVDPTSYDLPSNNHCGDPSRAEANLNWNRAKKFNVSLHH